MSFSHNSFSHNINSLELNEESFLQLLEKLIGESKYLQNNPPELVPVEDR
jgi:acetylornithine deacetylase